MDEIEAIKERHSVREYIDKPIEEDKIDELNKCIAEINNDTGLNIQLVTNETDAFNGNTHYGRFVGVKNYIALIGKKRKDLDEKLGYYGEKLAIKAQMLGLNTCFVALTYRKSKAKVIVRKGESFVCVIALGYGKNQGVQHKSKPINRVSNISESSPEWFRKGVECALLAPTAINQQQFYFEEKNGKVTARAGIGFYSKVDLGIAKYHFEVGSKRKAE